MKKTLVKAGALVLLIAILLCLASCGTVEDAAAKADEVLSENWNSYVTTYKPWYTYEAELCKVDGELKYWIDIKMTDTAKLELKGPSSYVIVGNNITSGVFKKSGIYDDVAKMFEKYPEVEVVIIFYDRDDNPTYYFLNGEFRSLKNN